MYFIIIWIFLKSRAQFSLHVQRLQPLLKENWEYFLAPKALTEVPEVQASSEVWGYGPPKKPWNFKLVSLKWQFLHFHIIFLWYSVRCLLLSQMSLGFSLLLLNQCSETERFLLLPLENHYKRNVHEADKNVIAFSERQHWHGLCYTQYFFRRHPKPSV